MDKKQAFALVRQVVEQYKGNAEEHRLLAEALRVLSLDDKKDVEIDK